jgi:hypothetical protein
MSGIRGADLAKCCKTLESQDRDIARYVDVESGNRRIIVEVPEILVLNRHDRKGALSAGVSITRALWTSE